ASTRLAEFVDAQGGYWRAVDAAQERQGVRCSIAHGDDWRVALLWSDQPIQRVACLAILAVGLPLLEQGAWAGDVEHVGSDTFALQVASSLNSLRNHCTAYCDLDHWCVGIGCGA